MTFLDAHLLFLVVGSSLFLHISLLRPSEVQNMVKLDTFFDRQDSIMLVGLLGNPGGVL